PTRRQPSLASLALAGSGSRSPIPRIRASCMSPPASTSSAPRTTRTFQTIGRVSTGFYALVVERDGTLVAATGEGVLRSTDGGRTWTVLAAGLPNGGRVVFNGLVHNGEGSFYAAVSGGGLWRVDDP
ncbi:MAG: WD40/YVTN/BNR-like repeat-containing protein, partial [bacterium]